MPGQLLQWFRGHQTEIIDTIARLVNMDSPTANKEAVDELGKVLRSWLTDAGAQVEVFPRDDAGDHMLARWQGRGPAPDTDGGSPEVHTAGVHPGGATPSGELRPLGGDRRPILFLCHADTVFDYGEAERRPFRIEGDRAFGPGVFDMKTGIALALWAVKGLKALGRMPARDVWMLVTTDEEVGSPTSRELIEHTARQCAAVLVMEPAVGPEGLLKTWRKGVGMFHLVCRGRAAHAGADPEKGVSAIEEMAHQIVRLHGLTDFDAGTTVNVGTVAGGSRTNVIADRAEARIDLRVMTAEEGRRMEEIIKGMQPVLPGARISITGGMNRPPMEPSEGGRLLFEAAREAGAELGMTVGASGTGGGSDGSFTAAIGVPTLDGLGAVGDGAHREDEHIVLPPLPERAALAARLLETL